MTNAWLSILMPTYQGARYLPQALDSLRGQQLEGVELLAVDDGSLDDTLGILERASRTLPVRILPGPKRKNWVASTNVALRAARGEFACLLHQDDGYLPDRLLAVRSLIAAWPQATLYTHWAEFRDDTGRRVGSWRPSLPSGQALTSTEVCQRLLVQNSFAIPCPTFRVRDALAVGGLDELLWYTADWDFWLKLASRGPTVCLARSLAFFRVHGASQTMERSRDSDAFRQQMLLVLERYLDTLQTDAATRRSVGAAARSAIEINTALSSWNHGMPWEPLRLLRALLQLDSAATWRLWRDSRLMERVSSRLRARLA
jgi:glycosyltransferase involved in cell wall biosynthesis